MRAWVGVAELVKTKTLKGGLVARCVPGLPFLLSCGLEVAFVPPQHDAPRRARVASVQDDGKGSYLVEFEGVRDITTAEMLVGCRCLARRADLPESALCVESDTLVGYEVFDAKQGFVGVVEEILENPGQVLLSVAQEREALQPSGCTDCQTSPAPDTDKRATLIPLVDAFIVAIDDEASRIDMDLPDGLLDL